MSKPKKSITEHGCATAEFNRKKKRYRFTPRNGEQSYLFDTILEKDLVFATGPAGTGKTHVMAAAVHHWYEYGDKIVLCRPAVDAGEDLGYFKGDVDEKIMPYFRPLLDELDVVFGKEKRVQMMEDGEIELASFATMRGRTFKNCFIVLDEAQNTTVKQMKLFLTRIGEDAKVIVSGDLKQNDLDEPENGLSDAVQRFKGCVDVGFCHLTKVVRSKIAALAVKMYGDDDHSDVKPRADRRM